MPEHQGAAAGMATAKVHEAGVAPPPAADFITPTWVQNESRAAVVGLSEARSDLLHRTHGPDSPGDRTFVLATDERSVLTPVLHDALRSAGASWVVREGDGALRDGLTGRRAARVADLVPTRDRARAGSATPAARPDPDDVSPIFLRQLPDGLPDHERAALDRALAFPVTRQVHVSVTVHHHARKSTALGKTAHLLLEHVLGTHPTSWGTHEPALAPWDPAALTQYARKHIARSPRLVVVGDGAVGTITVRRTAEGVAETTRLNLRGGEPGSDTTNATLNRVADALTLISQRIIVRSALALTRTGRADLNVPALIEAPEVPLAMVVGATTIKEAGINLDDGVTRFDARRSGSRHLPTLVLPLGTPEHSDWGVMTEVLRWIGPAAHVVQEHR